MSGKRSSLFLVLVLSSCTWGRDFGKQQLKFLVFDFADMMFSLNKHSVIRFFWAGISVYDRDLMTTSDPFSCFPFTLPFHFPYEFWEFISSKRSQTWTTRFCFISCTRLTATVFLLSSGISCCVEDGRKDWYDMIRASFTCGKMRAKWLKTS